MSKRSLEGPTAHRAIASAWGRGPAQLITLLLYGLTQLASADDSDVTCQFPAPPNASLADTLSQALKIEPACKKNDAFLFTLGQKLNQSRLYGDAIDRLEAAILLNPSNWPAHLEYAIALEGTGDSISANGILRNLLAVEEISPALKRQIKAQLEKRQPAVGPNTTNRSVLGMVAGYDNNLMGASRVSNFELTLPIGRVPVTLGEENQPKAGRFIRLSFEHEGFAPQGSGDKTWSYTLNANYRLSPDYSPANFGLLQLILERGNTTREGLYTSAGALLMQSPAGALMRHYKLGTGYDLLSFGGSCRLRIGSELERRSYPNANALNGHYLGGMSYMACPALGFQAQIRFGQDDPEHDNRAGGAQNQYTLRLGKNTTWGPGSLITELELYRQEDQRGYSPLLENNLKRTINRSLYRLEYRTNISDLGPYIGIEHIAQSASLSLFRVSNQVIYVGIRAVW